MSAAPFLLSYYYLPLLVFFGITAMSVVQAALPATNPVVSKPLSWFKVGDNPRKKFDEDDLRLLGKDLRKRQLQPLVALPDGTLICGERRLRAAKLEGLTELLVMIVTDPLTAAEQQRLKLVENLQRADLSNTEKCIGCVEYARSNPSLTLAHIASDLGFSGGMVTRWRSWENCIPGVQQALERSEITLNTMYDISKLPQDQQATALANYLSPQKTARNSNGASRKWLTCEMPSGMVVKLGTEGGDVPLADCIEELTALVKEMKKAEEQGVSSKTFQAQMKDKARA